jgi:hypothetical protein
MTVRRLALLLMSFAVAYSSFLTALDGGCGWTSNELFAAAIFFVLALLVSVLSFRIASKWWVALIAIGLLPITAAWIYPLALLFSPGHMSVGPCVHQSMWAAFSSLYFISGIAMLVRRGGAESRITTFIISSFVLAAGIVILKYLRLYFERMP